MKSLNETEQQLDFWTEQLENFEDRTTRLFATFLGTLLPGVGTVTLNKLGYLPPLPPFEILYALYIISVVIGVAIYASIRGTEKQAHRACNVIVGLYERMYGEEKRQILEQQYKDELAIMIYKYLAMGFILWVYGTVTMFSFPSLYPDRSDISFRLLVFSTVLIKSWVCFTLFRIAFDDLGKLKWGMEPMREAGAFYLKLITFPIRVLLKVLSLPIKSFRRLVNLVFRRTGHHL